MSLTGTLPRNGSDHQQSNSRDKRSSPLSRDMPSSLAGEAGMARREEALAGEREGKPAYQQPGMAYSRARWQREQKATASLGLQPRGDSSLSDQPSSSRPVGQLPSRPAHHQPAESGAESVHSARALTPRYRHQPLASGLAAVTKAGSHASRRQQRGPSRLTWSLS